jgi:hypothetical protein
MASPPHDGMIWGHFTRLSRRGNSSAGYRYTTPRGVGCLSSALFTGAMLGGILKVVGLFIFNTYSLYRLIV